MKRKRTLDVIGFLLAGVIMVCALLSPMSTEAATFYVATTGSNSFPGTEIQPFKTINKGVGVLKPGDTLLIRSGTYNERLNWGPSFPAGTSWNAPVTVKAYPGDIVTLLPTDGARTPVAHFYGAQTQYIILEGLILDAAKVKAYAVKITYPGWDPSEAAHHIRIQNSEIRNSIDSGFSLSNFNEIINCEVHNNGNSWFDHAFYIIGANNLVENSQIHNNSGWGLHNYNETVPGSASNNIYRNNLIYDNAQNEDNGHGAGIILGSGSGNIAYNNIIWGNEGGIQVGFHGSSDNKIFNNTIYGNNGNNGKGYCIFLSDTRDDIVQNNICWDNTSGIVDQGVGTFLGSNLTRDPLFVNFAQMDFHLREGSPAIDAGELVMSAPDDFDDFDGNSRQQGSAYDIGAYEFTGQSTDNIPPSAPIGLRIANN